MITAYEALAVDAARRERDRARAELRLLACLCPIGRWGLSLAGRDGVTLDSFEQPDTRAIFTALLAAERAGWIISRERTFCLARRALVLAGFWDENDTRTSVGPMRWGPGPLATLFCRVSRWDAEQSVSALARKLVAGDARKRGAA